MNPISVVPSISSWEIEPISVILFGGSKPGYRFLLSSITVIGQAFYFLASFFSFLKDLPFYAIYGFLRWRQNRPFSFWEIPKNYFFLRVFKHWIDFQIPYRGDFPLHWAARHKENVYLSSFLIKNKADINQKTLSGEESPLHLACELANITVIVNLIAQGASITQRNGIGQIAKQLISDRQAYSCYIITRLYFYEWRNAFLRNVIEAWWKKNSPFTSSERGVQEKILSFLKIDPSLEADKISSDPVAKTAFIFYFQKGCLHFTWEALRKRAPSSITKEQILENPLLFLQRAGL